MFFRRILYTGQFVAAVVLPTWVLVARGLLDDGMGWEFLVYLVACPFLSVAMLMVAGLIVARGSTRARRAVSWADAAVLSVWYIALLGYGLWSWPVLAALAVILTVVAFWTAVVQLFRETRSRFRGYLAEKERPSSATPPSRPDGRSPGIIVIPPPVEPPAR